MRYRWLAGPPDQSPCPGSTLSTVGRQNIHSQPYVRRSCVIRTTIVQVKGTPDICSHEHHAHLNVPMLGFQEQLPENVQEGARTGCHRRSESHTIALSRGEWASSGVSGLRWVQYVPLGSTWANAQGEIRLSASSRIVSPWVRRC